MLLISLGVFLGSLLLYRVLYTGTGAGPDLSDSYVAPINASAVCLEIASSVSSASGVFFNGTEEYTKDIRHYTISSSQASACSFEPGTPEDVGIALRILARTRCPFAVKCGGHATNQGFSSTPGVQIAMHRFSDVTYDSTTQTAKIGAGLIWDDVYGALEPFGVNVAGGRVSGIGVAGFTLGGGYSWHANQYGLTADTVEAFQLVSPDGTVMKVDATSHPDLFFGLKGGFNNFGIVTQFTFKTFPQTQVWGGTVPYNGPSELDQFTKAVANFAENNTDPKANMIGSYLYMRQGDFGMGLGMAILYYDGPSPPDGVFDDFLAGSSNNEGIFARSHLSLVQSSTSQMIFPRSAFHTVSVPRYPEDFLQRMQDETTFLGTTLPLDYGYVSLNVQPFMRDVYNHTTLPSAWPGSRTFFSPLNLAFAWTGDGTTDDVIINGLKQSAANLGANAGMTEGLSLYGNYALADTPLEAMYGANVERLRRIRKDVDPDNVMGLTGGFKF